MISRIGLDWKVKQRHKQVFDGYEGERTLALSFLVTQEIKRNYANIFC